MKHTSVRQSPQYKGEKIHAFQLNVKRMDFYTVLGKKRKTSEAVVSFSVSL
jgi:hypothetical protein